ncbi:MAG TPA: TolC family protein, partial [Blastocatellia bacterium]|nr:TolC family protein [Blastocatellia bacterium]
MSLTVALGAGGWPSTVAAAQAPAQSPFKEAQKKPGEPGQDAKPAEGVITQQIPKEAPPVAPGYKAPERELPSAERVGVDGSQPTPITLEEAVALALTNNKDITASRIDVELAKFDLKAAQGVYDPRLSTEIAYEKRETPVGSFIAGGADGKLSQTDATGSVSLSGSTPVAGGMYQIDLTSARQTTNNQFTSLNPQYPSALTFTYTQPLLKGLRIDDNRRRIEIGKKNLTLTDAQFRQRVIETITRVQQAYWDLTFALRNLQVQIEAVKQARAQVESNRRQVEQGILAPIDIVSAETQLRTFEQNVYLAQEAVTRAENNLKMLILPDRTAPVWSKALLPTSPVTLEPPRVPVEQAVQSALANRPEIEQLETTAEINEVNTEFFKDQTKPQVDLIGVFTSTGLAGSLADIGTNPLTSAFGPIQSRVNELSRIAGLPELPPPADTGGVPPALIGGANQSFSNLFGFTYPTARVGL